MATDFSNHSTEELKQLFQEEEKRIMDKITSMSVNHSYESIALFLAPLKNIYDEIERRKENQA